MPCYENALSRLGSLDALKQSEPMRALYAQLVAFRQRFPVDDRAFEFLQNSSPAVVTTVIKDFRVRAEGEADYSALLTNFVRLVQASTGGTEKGQGKSGKKEPRGKGRVPVKAGRDKRKAEKRKSRSRESSYSAYYSSVSGSSEDECSASGGVSSLNSQDERSKSGSGSSGASKRHGVGVEDAEKLLQSAITQASRDEQRRVRDADLEENRRVDMEVAQARIDAEEIMRARLAEFEATVRREMDGKIQKASQAAVDASSERMKIVEEHAQAEREMKVKAARADLQEAKRQLREAKEATERRRSKQQVAQTKATKVTLTQGKVAKTKVTLTKSKLADKRVALVEKKRRKERSRSRDQYRHNHEERERKRHRSRSPYMLANEAHTRGQSSHAESARGPEVSKMKAFRERYPMDDSAFDTLSEAPPDVQWAVVAQFKPRREGEDDYSALIASFVRSVLVRRAAQTGGRADEERVHRAPDRKHTSMLAAFRKRYPMDERAYATLERSPLAIQTTVMNCFQPRREGEDDYSALVMSFVRSVLARQGGDFHND